VILDTSAILAILFKEADAPYFARKIAAAVPCRMSVANLLEAAIVTGGRGESAESDLDRFVDAAAIELMPVTAEQVVRAREAWRRFGKGNHPAALNFGDCFAYALALTTGEPLLFKGEDFSRTDVESALAAGDAELLPPAEVARGGAEGVRSQRDDSEPD
jgi:ribonuclease VapC